jgi:choline dehydrogenase
MEADFVIVGAGSAGCVLAERLSANGRFTVIVLEAGGSDHRFWVQVPLGYGKTFYDKSINWAYQTEPDPGLNGQRDYWPRGKLLGGSSSINAMVYIRGNEEDFKGWEKAGGKDWGWKNVRRVYEALEAGPLKVTNPEKSLHPLCRAYIEAAQQAGLPFNPDFNGERQDGVGYYRTTIHGRRRLSAARAFLRPAMARANVDVLTHAHATRLTFDGKRATGVEVLWKGRKIEVKARREVILSAGSINSVQLLMLSGIGPAGELKKHGIPVRLDNRHVGQHMEDHVGVNYIYRAKVPSLNQILRPWWGKLLVGLDYVLRGRGPLASSLNQGGGFVRLGKKLKAPNIQLYMQAISTLKPKAGERPLLTPDEFPGFALGLSSCRPNSRGSITLADADPFSAPRITANAYSTKQDIAEVLAGVKLLRKIAAQPALAAVIAEELRPGPKVTSDKDLINDLRNRSGTVYHPSSTARMGKSKADSVVDNRLRVHGIKGLRVADASVFPNNITGNINGPCMMLGARAAEIILADHAPAKSDL